MFIIPSRASGSSFQEFALPRLSGRACDTCRRFKVKCSNVGLVHEGVKPCAQCLRTCLKCTYNEPPVKRGRRRKHHEVNIDVVLDWNRESPTGISRFQPPSENASSYPKRWSTVKRIEDVVCSAPGSRLDQASHISSAERKSERHFGADACDFEALPTGVHPCNENMSASGSDAQQAYTSTSQLDKMPQRRLLLPEYPVSSYDERESGHDCSCTEEQVNQVVTEDSFDEGLGNNPLSASNLPSSSLCPETIADHHTFPDLTLLTPGSLLSNSSSNGAENFWTDVHRFFDTGFIIFPVLCRRNVLSRVLFHGNGVQDMDLYTLLLSVRMLNAASEVRMNPHHAAPLLDLVREVERSRLYYDFSEHPSLDAVVVSLFLFTAYNVLEKHNRAFLYLDEASTLVEMVEVTGQEELRRKFKIETVLFNTKAASLAIYAKNGRARGAHMAQPKADQRQLFGKDQVRVECDDSDDDMTKVAMYLLKSLTEIHSAKDYKTLMIMDSESDVDARVALDAAFQHNTYVRIQAADINITRQWQLSSKLVSTTRGMPMSGVSNELIVERMGVAAMSWVCQLREGELRIVGLGKLAALASNIYALAGSGRCQYVLGGIAAAVMRGDHEKVFAPTLMNVINPGVGGSFSDVYVPIQDEHRQQGDHNSVPGIRADTVNPTDMLYGVPMSAVSPAGWLAETSEEQIGQQLREQNRDEDWDWLLQIS